MENKQNRVIQKKIIQRDKIITIAGELFIKKGARSVSMEDVAHASNIARRTLFNYFETKEELLWAVAEPVLSKALSLSEVTAQQPIITINNIIQLTLDLWHSCSSSLAIIYMVGLEESPRIADLHNQFLKQFRLIISKISGDRNYTPDDSRLVGKLVYRLFVPLLEVLATTDNPDTKYLNGFKALIEGCL